MEDSPSAATTMSEAAAAERGPTVRRPRGRLEMLMLDVCTDISNETATHPREGGTWTPHFIAGLIAAKFPGSGAAPSTGAISDNLERWRDLGFANVDDRPIAFLGFTDEGKSKGLASMKEAARAARAEAKRAAAAAEKAAQAEAQAAIEAAEAPADPSDHDGHTIVVGEPGVTFAEPGETVFLSYTVDYTPES